MLDHQPHSDRRRYRLHLQTDRSGRRATSFAIALRNATALNVGADQGRPHTGKENGGRGCGPQLLDAETGAIPVSCWLAARHLRCQLEVKS